MIKNSLFAGLKKAFLVGVAILAADVLAAQAVKVFPSAVTSPFTEYWEYSDLYHHDLIPNIDRTVAWVGVQYRLTTNSLGFKDSRVRDVPLKSDKYRLLFVGNSFTEGVGLPYEQTFAGMVARRLEPKGAEALNAGVFRYSPSIYYRKVRHLLEDVGLKVDHVAVFVDVSDAPNEHDYSVDENGNVRAVDDFDRKVRHLLKSNSLIVRFADILSDTLKFDKRMAGLKTAMRGDMGRHLSSWTYEPERFKSYGKAGLEKATRHMDGLASFLRDRGIGMTVAVYPWPNQITHQDLNSIHVAHWRDWAARHEAGFIDLFPHFINSEDPETVIGRYYLENDVHFNEKGNALVAEAFLEDFQAPRGLGGR